VQAASLGEWRIEQKDRFVGEIAAFTLQFLKSSSVQISLQNGRNLKLVHEEPVEKNDIYATKRYYFKILAPNFKLPDATVSTPDYSALIQGLELQAKRLHPPKNFCNVLAHSLELLEHESVQYNRELNLVVMKLQATVANLEDFSLPMAKKEGIKKYRLQFPEATLLYYAMIPKNITELKFSYFNVTHKEFRTLSLPVIVRDESVSTQSDIKPTEDKNKKIKIIVFGSIGALLFIYFLFKRSWLALLLSIAALSYMAYLMIPIKKVCVKRGAKIYILPTKQSTVFKINPQSKVYEELNRVGEYIKVKLSKEKIGWVRDEDLCKN
jgi:hypothetical protein